MNDERMTMKDFKREARKIKIRRKIDEAKMAICNAGQWVWDHKVQIGAAIGTGVTLVAEGRRVYDRVHKARNDYKSDRQIYDPTMHKKLNLKRKLSDKQNREIAERMKAGEKKHDIIMDMGVLK